MTSFLKRPVLSRKPAARYDGHWRVTVTPTPTFRVRRPARPLSVKHWASPTVVQKPQICTPTYTVPLAHELWSHVVPFILIPSEISFHQRSTFIPLLSGTGTIGLLRPLYQGPQTNPTNNNIHSIHFNWIVYY